MAKTAQQHSPAPHHHGARQVTVGRHLAPLTVLATLLIALTAQAGSKNAITKIDVEGTGENRLIRIHTTAVPTFTVFRLTNPMRVVVDVSGGDITALDAPVIVEDGVVGQIAFRQFSADGFLIGRVIVGFEKDLTYDVQAEGQSVVIRTGNLPGSGVNRAIPPPIAPVDRAAAERFELARREADEAARRAADERRRAEEAATFARTQQRDAERMAKEAERAKADAETAKAEALTLRQQAQEALARDRAQAEAAARRAEERLAELEQSARSIARSRADTERLAAKAERTRRNAEEAAALGEAQHKQQVAELQEEVAIAQREKKAATAARQRAETARREAQVAQRAADSARLAAEKTRADTRQRLDEIAARERRANAKLSQLASERERVEAQRHAVEERQLSVDAREQQIAAKGRDLDRQRRGVDGKQKSLDRERERLASIRRELTEAQKKLTDERKDAAEGRRRTDARKSNSDKKRLTQLGTERKNLERLRKSVDASQERIRRERTELAAARKELQIAQTERQQLNADRTELAAAQKKLKAALVEKDRLAAERMKLTAAQKKLIVSQSERNRLERERKTLERERKILEAKKGSISAAREALRRERKAAKNERKRLAAKAAEVMAAKSRSRKRNSRVVLASARTPAPVASRPSRTRRAHLRGIKRRGSGANAGVILLLDRTPSYEVQRLEDPPRLVIDLADTARTTPRTTYGVDSPFVRRVRIGDHGSVTRVVMDLSANASKHIIDITGEGLLIRMEPPPEPVSVAKSVAPAPSSTANGKAALRDVRFTGNRTAAKVILDIDGAAIVTVDDRSKKAWVLELRGATVAKALERSLDTTAYGSVVRLVSTYQASREPNIVKVVANLSGPATYNLTRNNGTLTWEIRGSARRTTVAAASTPQTAGFAAEAAVVARSTPKQTRRTKKRISIDLKDADIVNVIRLIAEISGQNIITGDDVKGKITLRLRNVPWDTALDTILKSKGYDRVRQHNIMRIALASKLQKEREEALETQKTIRLSEDTVIKMITVNYAKAADIVSQLRPLMSARGSVQTDERTNTIILEEVKSNIARLVELTRRLDKQTPQVLIEARIVEARTNNLTELGIQWGGTGQMASRSGNPTGLVFPGDVIASGAADDAISPTTGTSSPGRFAVNLPAPIGAGSGGGLGFVFGSAGGSQLLNLRLSALEETGGGRIISSPRITTMDNKKAKISQGIDVPVTVVSAAGANTRFIPANLELEVTPHVTNDGSILLKIKTSKNEPNFARTGANGDPTIEKKQAETEVLVRDGDTTVIGGIYTRSTSETFAKVPFFADIPVIGWLFKKRRKEETRAEMLVFITPRIVNREASMVESGATLPGTRSEDR